MSVCWRTKAHSSSASGPGLSRIASGTATLPTSCSSAARATSSSAWMPREAHSDRDRELGHVAKVLHELGPPLVQRLEQHVAGLAARRAAAPILLAVHAAVG